MNFRVHFFHESNYESFRSEALISLLFENSAFLPFVIDFQLLRGNDGKVRRLGEELVSVKLECKNRIKRVLAGSFELYIL